MSDDSREHRRLDRASWYLYDFGNTAIEFTIALHLTQWFIIDLGQPSVLFGVYFACSSWLVGVTSPYLGMVADQRHQRRSWFV